jgi:hypothetical protein
VRDRDLQIKTTLRFHSPQLEWPYSRKITTTNAGEDVMKQEPLYTVGENANWYSHCGKQYRDSSKS